MRGPIPNGGIQLIPQIQGPPLGSPVFNVGPLMNDVEVVALVAAGLPGSAAEAVTRAMELVAEVVVRQGELPAMIERLRAGQE